MLVESQTDDIYDFLVKPEKQSVLILLIQKRKFV